MSIDLQFIYTSFFQILKALPLTLVITIVPLIAGFGIGLATALIRIYRVRWIHRIADFYVSFLRGTPMLMHLFLIYYGIPMIIDKLAERYDWAFQSSSIPILVFVLIAFSLTAGAYMSEIIRSGILAVDIGQMEAAHAVGMSTFQGLKAHHHTSSDRGCVAQSVQHVCRVPAWINTCFYRVADGHTR